MFSMYSSTTAVGETKSQFATLYSISGSSRSACETLSGDEYRMARSDGRAGGGVSLELDNGEVSGSGGGRDEAESSAPPTCQWRSGLLATLYLSCAWEGP